MAEYIERYDMWVTFIRMPLYVKGFCRRVQGDNCAVINADLSDEVKRRVIRHEAEHFRRGDLSSKAPVELIEGEMKE